MWLNLETSVIWESLGPIGLYKRHQNTCTQEDCVEDREKMAIYRPRRKVIEQINVNDTWSSGFQPWETHLDCLSYLLSILCYDILSQLVNVYMYYNILIFIFCSFCWWYLQAMDMLDLIYSFISLQTEVVYTIMINIAKNIFMWLLYGPIFPFFSSIYLGMDLGSYGSPVLNMQKSNQTAFPRDYDI